MIFDIFSAECAPELESSAWAEFLFSSKDLYDHINVGIYFWLNIEINNYFSLERNVSLKKCFLEVQ